MDLVPHDSSIDEIVQLEAGIRFSRAFLPSEFFFGNLQPNCTKNDEVAPRLENKNTQKRMKKPNQHPNFSKNG
jgi:hypothetical protein